MKLSTVVKGLTVAGALAFASSAMADGFGRGSIKDAPRAAPFSWTGFYVGLNAGGAWSETSIGTGFSCTGVCPFTAASNNFIGAANSGSVSAKGFIGGIQAGYNLQSGNLVWGAEVDFNLLNASLSRSVTGITPGGSPFASSTGLESDWLMTARARLGITLSPTLLAYVTGGLAVADMAVTNSFTTTFGGGFNEIRGGSSNSSTKLGWTVGGGLELALNRNWSIKGEYLYVDLGSTSTSATVNQVPVAGFANSTMSTSADLTLHIARAGINYRF